MEKWRWVLRAPERGSGDKEAVSFRHERALAWERGAIDTRKSPLCHLTYAVDHPQVGHDNQDHDRGHGLTLTCTARPSASQRHLTAFSADASLHSSATNIQCCAFTASCTWPYAVAHRR